MNAAQRVECVERAEIVSVMDVAAKMMKGMKRGGVMKRNRVMVVHSRDDYRGDGTPFPPVGALGTVISDIDEYGEFDVMFDFYPCPVSEPDDSWVTHRSMVVFVDDNEQETCFQVVFERGCTAK